MALLLAPIHIELTSQGPDDCQKCKTRRISCDRAIPSCQKCSRRGFSCPGYPTGVKLRWDQGVASRGRLKGKSVPVRDDVLSPLTDDGLLSPEPRHGVVTSIPPMNPQNNNQPCPVPTTILLQENVPFSTASPWVNSLLENTSARRLLHHYSELMSSKLPWIDSINNPWRTIILPLATESPALLSAILSMAAEDLAMKYAKATSSNQFSSQAEEYRENALKLLTNNLAKDFTIDDVRPMDSKTVTLALAATLILCNIEIRRERSTSWRIHLRAARSVIRSCTTTNALPGSESMVNSFLIQKFFSINVFALISTFGDADEMISETFTDDCDSIFIEFLRIMQTVAQKAQDKCQSDIYARDPQGDILVDCRDTCRQLNYARERTIFCSKRLKLDSQATRWDLEKAVNMFYYAGLIYSHRAIHIRCCSDKCGDWRDKILAEFDAIQDVGRVSQDLLWPLFIAGTEIPRSQNMQAVSKKIMDVIETSGHWNGLGVLKFLQSLWESSVDGPVSWIDLARDWTRKGRSLLII